MESLDKVVPASLESGSVTGRGTEKDGLDQ